MSLSKPLLAAPARLASGFILVAVFLDMAGLGVSITVLPALIGNLAGAGRRRLDQRRLRRRVGARPVRLLPASGDPVGPVRAATDAAALHAGPRTRLPRHGGGAELWRGSLLGRLISAATASSFSICYAYVADVTTEENAPPPSAGWARPSGLGFILGPAMGGLLGAESLRAPFWAAAGLSLANAVFGFLVLPESLPDARRWRPSPGRRPTRWDR